MTFLNDLGRLTSPSRSALHALHTETLLLLETSASCIKHNFLRPICSQTFTISKEATLLFFTSWNNGID